MNSCCCPLCANTAKVVPPEWSGARILVKCPQCGEFETNKITIAELDKLRSENSPRIQQLQYSIASAEHRWHITQSQKLGMIVLESGPPRTMTKRDKKLQRRGTTTIAGMVYKQTDETQQGGDDET